MFLHKHPYEPFVFEEATKLIVGTLPPPRFTIRGFKEGDVDFCYGSRDGQLWPILNTIFQLDLKFETTQNAIDQRKNFLKSRKIGICDIVESAERDKVDASDLGMKNIKLRNLIGYLQEFKNIDTLIFTGGNSKNGPEYFFRKHLKKYDLSLEVISNEVPRIHKFQLPISNTVIPTLEESLMNKEPTRTIKTVSLTAPSGAANRAVGSLAEYKRLKDQNPNFNTIDFRVLQYQPFF